MLTSNVVIFLPCFLGAGITGVDPPHVLMSHPCPFQLPLMTLVGSKELSSHPQAWLAPLCPLPCDLRLGLSLHSSWLPVVRFIEEQFEQYLRDESGLNRKNIQDSRVHCCLYFISPFGRGSGGHLGIEGLGRLDKPLRSGAEP